MASPPLTGPGPDLVEVTSDPIDPLEVLGHVADPECGAVVLFLGTVRDHSPGIDGVTHLEYETYGEMVEAKIGEVVAETRERWPVARLAAVHRVGVVAVGEISVAVAASSPHRGDAFEAGSHLIDALKARAPIWKKEHWPGGAEWVREDLRHRPDPHRPDPHRPDPSAG
jgi:molybdopterin synthase catalytic subunit